MPGCRCELLLDGLRGRGLTVATAESCTGGSVAASLTAIPGASDVVAGGVVAYSNEVKVRLLGVDTDTLCKYGAVSESVACEMALGVCLATGADVGVSTTGIAGPGGGTLQKPVGTVCLAVAMRGQVLWCGTCHLVGDRADVVHQSVDALLGKALECVDRL